MKIWGAAIALAMMFAAAPAKAADFITYEGFSRGTVTFFDNLSPNPPVTKATGYKFTFIVPINNPAFDPKASVQGSNLVFSTDGFFELFQASACLAQSPNGQLPTSDPALVAGCGSVFTSQGKNSGFNFSGNFYDLKAQSSFGAPPGNGLLSNEFFDLPPSAVPEPATWFMMLLGFGMIGGAMRRRLGAADIRLTPPARMGA